MVRTVGSHGSCGRTEFRVKITDRVRTARLDQLAKAVLPTIATATVVPEQATPAPATSVELPSTEASAKAFIYEHESGDTLTSVNASGCVGLGQDCNGQLAVACPDWQTDYACQDKYFTSYMLSRYGSWTAAKAHWLARVPINGVDVGNWW